MFVGFLCISSQTRDKIITLKQTPGKSLVFALIMLKELYFFEYLLFLFISYSLFYTVLVF